MNRQMRRLQARVAANAARARMALTDWVALPYRVRKRRNRQARTGAPYAAPGGEA